MIKLDYNALEMRARSKEKGVQWPEACVSLIQRCRALEEECDQLATNYLILHWGAMPSQEEVDRYRSEVRVDMMERRDGKQG